MITKVYDLEERTARFGEEIIDFVKHLPRNPVFEPIYIQLIKSGTSIGANYWEANGASSNKDFKNKIFISKKEAKETKYWLRMVAKAVPEKKDQARILWKEANELMLIFSKITTTMKNKEKQ